MRRAIAPSNKLLLTAYKVPIRGVQRPKTSTPPTPNNRRASSDGNLYAAAKADWKVMKLLSCRLSQYI
jgi:hypothetical protein